MSGVTFWAVNDIQTDARLSDTRFGKDLGLLLAANVAPLVAQNNDQELTRLTREFYDHTSSIRYILFADPQGEISFGIPFTASEVQNSLSIRRRIQLPDALQEHPQEPLVRQHASPQGEVTDIFVNLIDNDHNYGVLAIGINPNPAAVASSSLTLDVTTAVFVSIWAMVILGAASNAITITRPIKELVAGVRNIAGRNFRQRIDLPFGGELGELIRSFNEMAMRLSSYEEQNIEELTAEKAKLENLVSTIADGAILLDSEMRVILANPAAIRLFHWEPLGDGLLESNLQAILPDYVQSALALPLAQLTVGDREGGEIRIMATKDGERALRVWLIPVFGGNDAIKGVAMTVQDITREVELNAAQSRFISNVSHELRTPLFNIKSFIETLHDYYDDLSREQRVEFLDTANRETDRLTRLVNDVLDLSRLESGRQYHFSPLDLNQTLEQTCRTYQLNAAAKEIELRREIAPNLDRVWGNYDLMLQVLSNLVGNALKFTPEKGVVTLRAYPLHQMGDGRSGSWVRVEVADTGIGIPLEDQERIFDRFFRVENRVHTLEGTGLGLSIVRNIVEKHDSHVYLKSEVNQGTTFWFDLRVFQDRCELPMAPSAHLVET
ncbi:MAG: HAMP domain-containing protein [Oscillatoriales cyanobacterium SM2_2_1]|nr:HAMP domain-containing protein [Oscillatoriales cyanobacterium SM2_2_1]